MLFRSALEAKQPLTFKTPVKAGVFLCLGRRVLAPLLERYKGLKRKIRSRTKRKNGYKKKGTPRRSRSEEGSDDKTGPRSGTGTGSPSKVGGKPLERLNLPP